jgi:hypothetical protein
VSNTQNQPLTVTLRGPDGASLTLVANTNINGTVTYETPAFNGKVLKGTWTLEGTRPADHVIDRSSRLVACPCTWEKSSCLSRPDPAAVPTPAPACSGSNASNTSGAAA